MRRLTVAIGLLGPVACGSTGVGEVAQGSDGGTDEVVVVAEDAGADAGLSQTDPVDAREDARTMDTSLAMDAVASFDAVAPRDARTVGVPAGPLDCAWLGDNANCYKTTLAAANVCLPASNTTGTLSADLKSCTYPDGTTIVFDSALVLPRPPNTPWNFTVTKQGQPCLRFDEERQKRFSLTTPGGAFDELITSTGGLTFICPDGKSYSQDNALTLLGCDGGFLGGLPGTSSGSSTTSTRFALLGGAQGEVPIFDCRK